MTGKFQSVKPFQIQQIQKQPTPRRRSYLVPQPLPSFLGLFLIGSLSLVLLVDQWRLLSLYFRSTNDNNNNSLWLFANHAPMLEWTHLLLYNNSNSNDDDDTDTVQQDNEEQPQRRQEGGGGKQLEASWEKTAAAVDNNNNKKNDNDADAHGIALKKKKKKKNAMKHKVNLERSNQDVPLPKRHLKPRIPNVFLAGAQKAGTTAVAQYLRRPEFSHSICWARPQNGLPYTSKEPHFFDHNHIFEQGGLSYYETIYNHCQDHHDILMDATPNYFTYPQRIYDFYRKLGLVKTLKLIFIVREPMSRELSWYHHLAYYVQHNYNKHHHPTPDYVAREMFRYYDHYIHHDNFTTTVVPLTKKGDAEDDGDALIGGAGDDDSPLPPMWTFAENVDQRILPRLARETQALSNVGLYVLWLRQWFTLFDRPRQIWVVPYDQVLHNQTLFLDQLHEFLNLSSYNDNDDDEDKNQDSNRRRRRPPSQPQYSLGKHNQKHTPNEDKPSCAIQESLYRYFEPYNEQLYQLLDQYPGPSFETRPFPRFQFQCKL